MPDGLRREHSWPQLIRSRAALADLGNDSNVDDVHRRCLMVYFVKDSDVARVQPAHACGAPRDRTRR